MRAAHISFERAVELLPFPNRQQAFRVEDGWTIDVDGACVSLSKASTHVVIVGVPFVVVPAAPEPAPVRVPDIATEVEKLMRPPAPTPSEETQQKHKRRR